MRILIKLARFVNNREQAKIKNEIHRLFRENKLRNSNFKISSDTWAPEKRILVNLESTNKKLVSDLYLIPGIWQIIVIKHDAAYNTINDVLSAVSKVNRENKRFHLISHYFKGARFHSKAFDDRWKNKFHTQLADHEAQTQLYMEINKTYCRIGKIISPRKSKVQMNDFEYVLVLQNPRTRYEIADFIRLGIMFSCSIRLTCDIQPRGIVEDLLTHAKKIMKGWQKTNITIYETIDDAILNVDSLGFSLWSYKNEVDLIKCVKHKMKLRINRENIITIGLVFGNEQEGLNLHARKIIKDIFHLGPPSSEPLRASHAAAYALGILSTISS